MIGRCTVVGRGAVGAVYCAALVGKVELSVAAEYERVLKYKNSVFTLNGTAIQPIEYVIPTAGDSPAELIIITTKWSGFHNALDIIEPLVGSNTTIIPLLNGLLPYELTAQKYGALRTCKGYYVGCTATNNGGIVEMRGHYNTVIESGTRGIEEFFKEVGIVYSVAEDMERSRWLKFIINLGLNHTTALRGGLSYGELKQDSELLTLCEGLMREGAAVAKASGINNAEGLVSEAMSLLDVLIDSDYGSMAQDVISGRATEREILGDDLVRRARLMGVPTPLFISVLEQGY